MDRSNGTGKPPAVVVPKNDGRPRKTPKQLLKDLDGEGRDKLLRKTKRSLKKRKAAEKSATTYEGQGEAPVSRTKRGRSPAEDEHETLQQAFLLLIGQPECHEVLSSERIGVTTAEQLRRLLKNKTQPEQELFNCGLSRLAASDIWNGLQEAANTTETGSKNGSGSSNTSQRDPWANASDISAARAAITGTDLWQPQLTSEDLPLVGRESAFQQIDAYILGIKSGTQGFNSFGKGQPLLGTGATSGAGKSRLLQEFRQKNLNAGAGVITLPYNSLENLGPDEKEHVADNSIVEKAFLSRLLCMMLPEIKVKGLAKSGLWNQYNVTRGEVEDLIAEKFAGKDVFILVDEIVNLSTKNLGGGYADSALNKVVSVLGSICHGVTDKLSGKSCIGFFTALSTKIIGEAQTVANRLVKVVKLPLLSQKDTSTLIDRWTKKMGKTELSATIKKELFALTAGHARMLEAFLCSDYVNTWKTQTLQGILPAVQDLCSIDPPSSEDIIAMLAQRQKDKGRLEGLCRRSLVQQLPNGKYLPVPVLLYHWASSNVGDDLGKDLKAFLDACWNRIFLEDRKQGLDGKPLENILSCYERLRRHWLSGEIQLSEFFKGSTRKQDFPWSEVKLQSLATEVALERSEKNKWANFKLGTLNDTSALYKQVEDGRIEHDDDDDDDEAKDGDGGNFPLYDWFTVVEANGEKVPIGSQSKHGRGKIKNPDPRVISVKFSTLAAPSGSWKKRGWLVLNGEALREYLGPALSAAAVCVLLHPEGPKPCDDP